MQAKHRKINARVFSFDGNLTLQEDGNRNIIGYTNRHAVDLGRS